MKKTKIVCTIGPKTESEEMLSKMLDAGMNVMRLNFSHGDYAEHGQRIQNLRNVMSKTGKKAAILLDTKGPEIRTIKLEGGNDVSLKAGQTFTFTTDKSVVGNNEIVAVTYEGFTSDLSVGGGVRYVGSLRRGSDGAVGTPDHTEGYWVADAKLGYRVNSNLDLQLNMYNLFDTDYVASINKSGYRYHPGEPRTFMLTANVHF